MPEFNVSIPEKKADILARLQKDILSLQGYGPPAAGDAVDIGWGRIDQAFPNGVFPLGAVHEFICSDAEAEAAAGGFISGLLAALMRDQGAAVWISTRRTVFPPALKTFGISPDRIIFLDLQREKDVLWALEEALQCGALAAVAAELPEISFTASRRLQLLVEQSRVTGILLRRNPRNLNTTAAVSRWKISPLPSVAEDGLPGIGFPRWQVELLKVRNGRPGTWQVEWTADGFRHIPAMAAILSNHQKKTG